MFGNNSNNYENMDTKEMLALALNELDEIKRYSANVYKNTDSEVGETRDIVRKLEAKLQEMDRQIDRIERFERELNEIKSILKSMDRRIK